jgi:hypothetical protein
MLLAPEGPVKFEHYPKNNPGVFTGAVVFLSAVSYSFIARHTRSG